MKSRRLKTHRPTPHGSSNSLHSPASDACPEHYFQTLSGLIPELSMCPTPGEGLISEPPLCSPAGTTPLLIYSSVSPPRPRPSGGQGPGSMHFVTCLSLRKHVLRLDLLGQCWDMEHSGQRWLPFRICGRDASRKKQQLPSAHPNNKCTIPLAMPQGSTY